MAIVICDTSSLIKLSITETLNLLPKLFRTVAIPGAVYQECPPTLRAQIDSLGFSLETPKARVFVQATLYVRKPPAGSGHEENNPW